MTGLLIWLLLGLGLGLLLRPYQAISELGFRLQRDLWAPPQGAHPAGCLIVFVCTSLLILLAWGPLADGRGGGVTPLLALDRAPSGLRTACERLWWQQLSLRTQLCLLPLLLLVSAVADGMAQPWRGEGWNGHQLRPLLDQACSSSSTVP